MLRARTTGWVDLKRLLSDRRVDARRKSASRYTPRTPFAMTPFDFVAVAISIVLGLGITELLSSGVKLFLHRKEIEFDWIPFVWAVTIFITILQYWWVFYFLSDTVEIWTPLYFLFLICVLTCLYVAAALVFPDTAVDKSEGLKIAFESHGKWSVFSLGVYVFLVVFVNMIFYDTPFIPNSLVGILTWVLLVLAVIFPFISNRKTQVTITISWFIILLYNAWNNSGPY